MILKKYISVLTSIMLVSGAASAPVQAVSAVDYKMFSITFLDFDGNVMKTIEVEEGDPINYSAVDVTTLHKHLNVTKEQAFASWDIHPDFADNDYVIHALSKTATISVNSYPTKKRYFNTQGNVQLSGLNVSIKISEQKPDKDQNGNYITEDTVTDITSSCSISPSKLSEAFANSDKATISVFPIGDTKALCKFDISCYNNLGDVNGDGTIDSTDASSVLMTYVNIATSADYTVDEKTFRLADVNLDGEINSRDASYILKYYAQASVSDEAFDWDKIIDYDSPDTNI